MGDRRRLGSLYLIGLLLASAGPVRAQTADEPALKAAFLHNFVHFTGWPSSTTSAGPFALCVLDSEPVARELEAVERAAAPGTASGVVRRVEAGDNLRACALLYVADVAPDRVARLLASLGDAPVLTVGDGPAFTRAGGIVHFFVENNRMRFAINPEAARRARLQVSSRLLRLAAIVPEARQ